MMEHEEKTMETEAEAKPMEEMGATSENTADDTSEGTVTTEAKTEVSTPTDANSAAQASAADTAVAATTPVQKIVCKVKPYLKKKPVIIGCVVVLVIALLLVFGGNRLSSSEGSAAGRVRNLVGMMKDPDSFKLREDILVLTAQKEDEGIHRYTYITYSANNSYGAAIKSTCVYIDGKYIGDLEQTKDDFSSLEDYKMFLLAKIFKAEYSINKSAKSKFSSGEAQVISRKKIAKELGIDYVK